MNRPPILGLCPGSSTYVTVTEEALDVTEHGTILCAYCATPYRVPVERHKHKILALRVPAHAPHVPQKKES